MKVLFLTVMTRLFSLVHPRIAGAVARPIAWLVWHFSRRLREVSLKNLALCYPHRTPDERHGLARRAMVHYVRNILEAGIAWHWSLTRFNQLFLEPVGEACFRDAHARGRGVIVLAPHCGSWEFLCLRVTQDVEGAILYKPGAHPDVEAKLVDSRQRFGTTLLPANRKGIKGLYQVLRNGQTVGILPDQEPRDGEGRFAPFFGVPALTGVMASRLARRTDAAVVFSVCVRRPKGRYQVHFLPAEDAVRSEDLDVATAALNRGVECCIRISPAQYLWAYKRFRARPEGEQRFY